MEHIKFSFIIPTVWKIDGWGEERLNLLKCLLQSIVCQTYTNWEVVLIYDGSNSGVDESHKLMINEYLKDNRIKYYSIDKSDLIAGTNKYFPVPIHSRNVASEIGSGLSKGEWIIHTNDDNYYTPNLLQEIVDAINLNEDVNFVYWEMIMGKYHNIHSHNKKDYGHFIPLLKPCYIDWGQFATKREVLKKHPIRLDESGADGYLVGDMIDDLVPTFIDKCLFVHN